MNSEVGEKICRRDGRTLTISSAKMVWDMMDWCECECYENDLKGEMFWLKWIEEIGDVDEDEKYDDQNPYYFEELDIVCLDCFHEINELIEV